jgi:hypothetical protein
VPADHFLLGWVGAWLRKEAAIASDDFIALLACQFQQGSAAFYNRIIGLVYIRQNYGDVSTMNQMRQRQMQAP